MRPSDMTGAVRVFATLLVLLLKGGRAQTDLGFDYLMLTRQWGPTFCENNNCDKPTYNLFTIHGLWPNSNDGNHPAFCVSSGELRMLELQRRPGSAAARRCMDG
jgi:ribonuclease T2